MVAEGVCAKRAPVIHCELARGGASGGEGSSPCSADWKRRTYPAMRSRPAPAQTRGEPSAQASLRRLARDSRALHFLIDLWDEIQGAVSHLEATVKSETDQRALLSGRGRKAAGTHTRSKVMDTSLRGRQIQMCGSVCGATSYGWKRGQATARPVGPGPVLGQQGVPSSAALRWAHPARERLLWLRERYLRRVNSACGRCCGAAAPIFGVAGPTGPGARSLALLRAPSRAFPLR